VPSAFAPQLPPEDFDGPEGGAGPECVTFVYQQEPEWEHWPYSPEKEPVLRISTSVATRLEYRAQKIMFDVRQPDLTAQLQKASEKNNIVMLLIDGSTLINNTLQQRLQEYDSQPAEASSTVIVWRSSADFNSNLVQAAFPNLSVRRPRFFYPNIDSPEKLDKIVAEALDALKMAALRRPNNPKRLPPTSTFNSLPPIMGPGN
jgi:hypothetical protein